MILDKNNVSIEYGDSKVWDAFGEADTDFVFQFNSDGMKKILKSTKPRSIDQLAELNALYRPGPLNSGLVDKYIEIKRGDKPIHEILSIEERIIYKILKRTYGDSHCGLMVFQEDVMKICQEGSGFTLSEADDVRKAMGKKKQSVLEKFEEPFIKNWKYKKLWTYRNQIDFMSEDEISDDYTNIIEYKADPSKIWSSLIEYSKYAFNKSHSVAYAVIAYHTMELWIDHQRETLDYIVNFDTKKRSSEALLKCRELGYRFTYPSIFNMANKNYGIENGIVVSPGNADRNYESYVDFLFEENSNKYTMIYKGVCDNLTQDRLGLVSLIDALPKKVMNQALYMEESKGELKNLDDILENLKLLHALTFESDFDNDIRFLITVPRVRSNLPDYKITIHKDNSVFCKINICKYDKKYFEKIRDGIISNRPYINTVGIENRLNRLKENYINKGLEDKVYYKMRDALEEYMYEQFNCNEHKAQQKMFIDVYAILLDYVAFDKSTKLTLRFNDVDDIFYIKNSLSDKFALPSIGKNSLIKLTMEYSPYINKRRCEFVYDFDILDLQALS